jgi:predicted homoserine dehydrogenase-like protein
MNYLQHFRTEPNVVRACLVGAGEFGRSLLGRAARQPWLELRIVVDRSAEAAAEGMAKAGVARNAIAPCETAASARAAFAAGKSVAAGRLDVVLELPFNILVEASGQPEPAAVHALAAIESGRHVAMVSKEADVVVGPLLAAAAAARGLVCSPIDGDQPSLLIGLITWAELLGFEIIAAGKASEYDFVFDPASGTILSNGRLIEVPRFNELWSLGERPVPELVALRAEQAAALPQHLSPDLCELAVVANATGLLPDVPDFHAPIARIAEVPSILATREQGGLLAGTGRLDVFHCLRLAEEISFAGGVFVVVRCEDAASWKVLEDKGHILGRQKDTAMLWLPRHLLGMEVGTTLLEAVLLGASSGGPCRPVVDLVGRARHDLARGVVLSAEGHHHEIAALAPELQPSAAIRANAPVPLYLLHGRRLQRDVAGGELIGLADVEMDPGAPLFAMRRRQDAFFLSGETAA